MTTELPPLDSAVLPPGIRARFVENVNGLRIHVLEAGFETPGRPCLLLLHGFPELAYSWRKVMGPLAAAGFHVVAPDQRGYGRTTGWDRSYDGDVASKSQLLCGNGRLRSAAILSNSADIGCAPLGFRFYGGLGFCRQLKNSGLLTLTQRRQEHDLPIGKLQGVVMSGNFVFVDLPKDRSFVTYHFVSPGEQSDR
jgi:hypothetical protein